MKQDICELNVINKELRVYEQCCSDNYNQIKLLQKELQKQSNSNDNDNGAINLRIKIHLQIEWKQLYLFILFVCVLLCVTYKLNSLY